MESGAASEIESFEICEDGESRYVQVFELKLRGTTVHLSSLGATIIKFLTKENDDEKVIDIVAGYKDAKTFHDTGNPPYFNGIVGRVANRIAAGKFSLGKNSYEIFPNNPPNALHGGKTGFSHKIWQGTIVRDGSAVRFVLESPDGDQGFPGCVTISVVYSLRPSFSSSGVILQLDIKADLSEVTGSEVQTPINLANHTYFNLGDEENGVLDHSLIIESDSYTPVDATLIPTREVRSVQDDPVMDFRHERSLRDALEIYGVRKMDLSAEQARENLTKREYAALPSPYGFDHNYVVRDQPGTSLPKVGCLNFGPRHLTIYSNAPGVQVYTSNYLGDSEKSSSPQWCKDRYGPWQAICLETQHFPDSICLDTTKSVEGSKAFWAGKCPILTKSQPTYKQTMIMHLEVDYPNTEASYRGCDTDGKKYASIDEMWNDQDLSTWYTRAKGWYEENCSTTIDGVLGGIGYISDRDLKGSRDFLNELTLPSTTEGTPSVACECGAGIGRVTKGLLLDFADRCDLVESSSRLLYSAPDHIGDSRSHRCRFYCAELQDWQPTAKKYSIIWIQWALCYLTDFDIVEFLRRCSESLVDGGWIILKENTCSEEAFVVDVEDASVTRSLEYWLDLIAKSELQVKRIKWQDDFPDEIFPVPMIALQK